VFFELDGREGASKVVFGRRGDARLIGAVALEELGLMLDPLKRELRPLRLMLARVVSTTGEAPFPSAHQP
jgi:hypothetical protein